MNILVLVPTYKKSINEIKDLYIFLNIKTDAVFANQCGENKIIQLEINDKKITIVCSDTIGVSKNRNILLGYANGELNVFIDDDCPLTDDYEFVVSNFYKQSNFDCCVFNGVWETRNNKLIHYKNSRKITKFNQISYAGGPGFVCTKVFSESNKIKYNENVGTPNYICAGEDSLFYFNMVKAKTNFFRSSDIIFKVAIDETNSSYFKGIDERYVVTRGFITKTIHSYLFFVYKFRHAFRFKKQGARFSIFILLKFMNKGAKLSKEHR